MEKPSNLVEMLDALSALADEEETLAARLNFCGALAEAYRTGEVIVTQTKAEEIANRDRRLADALLFVPKDYEFQPSRNAEKRSKG